MTQLKVSKRAKEFVENWINTKDEIIKNIILYYLSQRHPTEILKDVINKTVEKDEVAVLACEYFNVIPPISQSAEDFAFAISSFINYLFDEKQINNYTTKKALFFLDINHK
jgi:hypothetical protein